jgi:hypothetical protein
MHMYIYTIHKLNLHLVLKQKVRSISMTFLPTDNHSNLKFTYKASKCYKCNCKTSIPTITLNINLPPTISCCTQNMTFPYQYTHNRIILHISYWHCQ